MVQKILLPDGSAVPAPGDEPVKLGAVVEIGGGLYVRDKAAPHVATETGDDGVARSVAFIIVRAATAAEIARHEAQRREREALAATARAAEAQRESERLAVAAAARARDEAAKAAAVESTRQMMRGGFWCIRRAADVRATRCRCGADLGAFVLTRNDSPICGDCAADYAADLAAAVAKLN